MKRARGRDTKSSAEADSSRPTVLMLIVVTCLIAFAVAFVFGELLTRWILWGKL